MIQILLLIGVVPKLEKAVAANVHLLAELGALGKQGVKG